MSVKELRESPNDGNIWLLSICLVIFITLWKFIFFMNLAASSCRLRNTFWLTQTDLGAPFNLSVMAFSLFTLWALVEIYLAHREHFPGRWTTTIVGVFCLALSMQMLFGLRAQYESFEWEWGARESGDITLASMFEPTPIRSFDVRMGPYTEFDLWEEVRCNPKYKDPKTEKEFCKLIKKFDKEHNTILILYYLSDCH